MPYQRWSASQDGPQDLVVPPAVHAVPDCHTELNTESEASQCVSADHMWACIRGARFQSKDWLTQQSANYMKDIATVG